MKTSSTLLPLPIETAASAAAATLVIHGAMSAVARTVARTLLDNELSGYSSHGLQRLLEYRTDIAGGAVDPQGMPVIEAVAPRTWRVDGRRAFGAVTAEAVRTVLRRALDGEGAVFASVVNSHHLGRLAAIAEPLAEEGLVVLGLCNYLGAGRKVVPRSGAEARLATNPLVFAAPTSGAPVVLDMSTSVVSEGRVRTLVDRGEVCPEGWLVDRSGSPVVDPRLLYTLPPEAFLLPLGGDVGQHKGFGLALMVEILAGVLTQAGWVRPDAQFGGNGGFFVAFPATLAGSTDDAFRRGTSTLLAYLLSAGDDAHPVTIPGWQARATRAKALAHGTISLSSRLWKEILGPPADGSLVVGRSPRLTDEAVDFLADFLARTPGSRVLEFGCGASTVWFADRVGRLVSIEHEPEWVVAVLGAVGPKVDLRLRDLPYHTVCNEFEPDSFDLVLVDGLDIDEGRMRLACAYHALPLLKRGGLLMFDNAQVPEYAPIYEMLDGWPMRRTLQTTSRPDYRAGNQTNWWVKP